MKIKWLTVVLFLIGASVPRAIGLADGLVPSAKPIQTFEDQVSEVAPAWTKLGRVLIEVNTQPSLSPQDRAKLTAAYAVDMTLVSGPEAVANAYGYVPQWFGHILAITPPAMTVLNTDPSLSELPLNELATASPQQFLLRSLTQAQFTLLATTGLGMNDLTPDQQALFRALLPDPFRIISSDAVPPQGSPDDAKLSHGALLGRIKQEQAAMNAYSQEIITVPPDDVLSQVRLHAYLNQEFDLDSPSQGSFGFENHGMGYYSSGDRKLVSGDDLGPGVLNPAAARLAGLLKTQTPNVPKQGDLNWRNQSLASQVSVNGLKTVDDLVNAIAHATHLELYADPNYGADPLLIAGDVKTKYAAGELLQALSLCVCGTWRQVGPAYVLTDDIPGLGARRQFNQDIVQGWTNRLTDADKDVQSRLSDLNWLNNLYTFPGDTGDLTKDQLLAICSKGAHPSGTVKWLDLPPNVQAALQKTISDEATLENFVPEDAAAFNAILGAIKPDSSVEVDADIELALELPNTGSMSLSEYRVDDPNRRVEDAPHSPGPITLTQAVRGVLCAPRTPAEARKVVDLLPSLGLNTLFLDVFSNGRSYFENTAIPPETDSAAGVLDAALAEASSKNISVYAVIDTFCWRKDGASARPAIWLSQFDEDLNIFGEPSHKGVQRRLRQNAIWLYNPDAAKDMLENAGSEGWVSPADESVRETLPQLVKQLAETHGLAGLIFQDTAPPGYGGSIAVEDGTLDLGYTLANRLSFLRLHHADPIDLGGSPSAWFQVPNGSESNFDLSIPGFGGYAAPLGGDGVYMAAPGMSSSEDIGTWYKFRIDADMAALKQCFLSARSANAKLPLFMRERVQGYTIDPWTDPAMADQITSAAVTANPYSYVNSATMLTLPINDILSNEPGSLTWEINGWYDQIGRGKAGGIVLDMETANDGEQALALVEKLQPYLQAN